MDNTKLTKFGDFSILMIAYVWVFVASAVSPALGSMAQDFPGVSTLKLQLVSVSPFVTSIIFSVAAGILAKRYDKKSIVLGGLVIYGITGMLPYWATSIDQIILLRLLTGIGVGLILPLPNIIIAEHYDGEPRKKMLGWATALANVANVINSVLIGFLLMRGWRYCFLAFAIVLAVAVINLFGLPKSPPQKQTSENMQAGAGCFINRIPKIVYLLAFYMMMNWAILQLNILNMAVLILSENLGAPWMIGLAIAIPGFGCIFSGALFPQVFKRLKNYLAFAGLFLFTLGSVTLYYTHSFSTLLVANLLEGIGSGLLVPYLFYVTSTKVDAQQYDFSFGIVTGAMHLGILFSPFLQVGIAMLGNTESLRYLYLVTTIALAIATLISFVYERVNSKQQVEVIP
ncbi:Putative multidrug resistance protein MdtD [Sporomusa silvacetica DSM 10669]|uniref:Multidrug resistance protein MdtD n=1 Tax=Sporomusa silvacetica DSM 10669 TaxID=1123289 RepID=A0ABZ3IFP6_9FIRM|nr:4-hydroxybenzoate transporter PcaK [Sporomusa silvacetica DSM 10669]